MHYDLLHFSSLPEAIRFPDGLMRAVLASKDTIAHRFVIVDNSASTIKKDCHNITGVGIKMK